MIKGFIGIDEVGRGPLAGPVTVCAVYIENRRKIKQDLFGGEIRDSKKITKSLRNSIFLTIRENRYNDIIIKYAVFSRNAKYIDRHGIQKATQVCASACVRKLMKQGINLAVCRIKTDAGIRIDTNLARHKSYIKGDERFVEIALASILAKESRDRHMRRLSKAHDVYGWISNVGYGTPKHREALLQHGKTNYHRLTYLKGF